MPIDFAHSRLMRLLKSLFGGLGLGLVCEDDPDFVELKEMYQRLAVAHRTGDLEFVLGTLGSDYHLRRTDRVQLDRAEIIRILRSRFESQIESDYREEPAHFAIRGTRATVASRIFARSRNLRDGKWIDMVERAEHVTTWQKTASGWVRIRARIRMHEQNVEIVEIPPVPGPERAQKFLV